MTAPAITAAAGVAPWPAVLLLSLLVAALLIGAFAWCGHRLARRRRLRTERGAARAEIWHTPDGTGPRGLGQRPDERPPGR
ncbi:hypothetical protein ACFXPX_20540 [Kitasatospora sp. NPDC059146]|uniref:hypothetical protein n=1 Tax=unclassified Kitasatospora TaxID=2633591 RepID=UPI00368148D6